MENLNKKRLVIRIILLALLVGLCFALFYIGKVHEVLMDNKTVSIDGKEYQAIPYMNVIVDGDEEKSLEFYADDRDAVKLQGPSHTLTIKVIDEQSEKVLKTVEYKLPLGTKSSVMVSLPAIVDGATSVELPLPTLESQEATEEQTEEGQQKNESESSPVDQSTQQIDSNKTIEGPTTTE